MLFKARIQLDNINPYVPIDAARDSALRSGWKRPLPVLVQVNGAPEPAWRINMMPVGDGSFRLNLSGIVREASGTRVGDEVAVLLAFDTDNRGGPIHEMPAAFRAGLEASASARARWEALPPSRRKEILRYLATLKTEDARARNITRAMRVLSGARERFMARDWNADRLGDTRPRKG